MVDYYNRWFADYPGQRPQDDPAYMRLARSGVAPTINSLPGSAQAPPPTAQPQPVSPPTIHADLIQIASEAEVENWPASAGAPLAFITKDESKIIFKTVGPDGVKPLDIYVKQPPRPPKPEFDPAAYVRRDELNTLIEAALISRVERAQKKEATHSEPV